MRRWVGSPNARGDTPASQCNLWRLGNAKRRSPKTPPKLETRTLTRFQIPNKPYNVPTKPANSRQVIASDADRWVTRPPALHLVESSCLLVRQTLLNTRYQASTCAMQASHKDAQQGPPQEAGKAEHLLAKGNSRATMQPLEAG